MTTIDIIMHISVTHQSKKENVQGVTKVQCRLPNLSFLATKQVNATSEYAHYHEQLSCNRDSEYFIIGRGVKSRSTAMVEVKNK